MGLTEVSDEELVDELRRRGRIPACLCGRWQTYLGPYDQDGHTWRCCGCLRATARCRCR